MKSRIGAHVDQVRVLQGAGVFFAAPVVVTL